MNYIWISQYVSTDLQRTQKALDIMLKPLRITAYVILNEWQPNYDPS